MPALRWSSESKVSSSAMASPAAAGSGLGLGECAAHMASMAVDLHQAQMVMMMHLQPRRLT